MAPRPASRAGTTTIIDFVHPERGEAFLDALRARLDEAAVATADYGLHMAVTWWGDDTAESMASCIEEGVPTFKLYMAYKETVGLAEADLVKAMATISDLDALALIHAEHGDAIEHLRDRYAAQGKLAPLYHPLSRPAALEGEATNRIASLSGVLGTSIYVVHVTCRESVEAIARAQQAGAPVHGETCPQYLLLDTSAYDQPDLRGCRLRHRSSAAGFEQPGGPLGGIE